MPDNAGSGIRPIFGVPGAAFLGDRHELESTIQGVVISPKQNFAVGVNTLDAQIMVVDLSVKPTVVRPVRGAYSAEQVIAISPSGSAAAVFDGSAQTILVIGGLPRSPQLLHRLDASRVPGQGTIMAVSDDGAIVLTRFVDGNSDNLWMMAPSGDAWPITHDRPVSATFFPNSRNAVVTGPNGASLILEADGSAARIHLASSYENSSGFSGVSTSEDGRQVFLADNSGIITIIDIETQTPVTVDCRCRPSGFHRLKGTSVFRLTEPSGEPVVVLDASSNEPRIVIIPTSTGGR